MATKRTNGIATLIAVMLFATACTGSGDTTLEPGGQGDSSGVGSTPTAPDSAIQQPLDPAFLAWIAPLDAGDVRLAGSTYGVSTQEAQDRPLGECLRDSGFRTFAEAVLSAPPSDPSNGASAYLFPDLEHLGAQGFSFSGLPDRAAADLMGDMISTSIDDAEGLADAIAWARDRSAEHPEWQLSESDLEPLIRAVHVCWETEGPSVRAVVGSPAFNSARQRLDHWRQELRAIDERPEVQQAVDNTMACLRGIGVPTEAEGADAFTNAETIDAWLAAQFGIQIQLDYKAADPTNSYSVEDFDRNLRRLGQQYAACVEGLVAARGPHRVEARNRLVQDDYAVLLETQNRVADLMNQANKP